MAQQEKEILCSSRSILGCDAV